MFKALLLMLLGLIVRVEARIDGDEGTDDEADPDAEEGEEVVIPPAEAEELVVAIGKDPEAVDDDAEIMAPDDTGQPPSTTLQNLRKKAREDAKALRRLEQERDAAIAAASAPKQADPAAVVVGEKPTLESCDYDQAKLETELTNWITRKSQAASQEQQRIDARKADETAYGERLNQYNAGKTLLKVPNFAAAETAVTGVLSNIQQSIIIKHAKNSALVVFALGNDPAKLKELASITDPIDFAIKARELEQDIKTVKRTMKPEGKAPAGSGSGATAAGSTALQRAEKQADATGDRSEVHKQRMAAKRAAREAGK